MANPSTNVKKSANSPPNVPQIFYLKDEVYLGKYENSSVQSALSD